MIRIGILVVATGKYISFVEPLWQSVQKHFLKYKGYQVNMFVFTDSKNVPPGTHRIFQEHKVFPYATLLRYHMFDKNKKALSNMDYLFYCDADMKFVSAVGSEILGKRVATLHPGFYDQHRNRFTYERNPRSRAFIPYGQGRSYYCGGFNGGSSKEFLKLSRIIKENIDADLKEGIIAEHNDESHLNRYFLNHKPTVILSPAYCYPEELVLPFEKKLIALDKDHSKFRYSGATYVAKKIQAVVHDRFVKILADYRSLQSRLVFILAREVPILVARKIYQKNLSELTHSNITLTPPKGTRLDLVCVAFNNPEVVELQIKFLSKNLIDPFAYTVVDNSSDLVAEAKIKQVCLKNKIGYIRFPQNPFTTLGLPNHSHGVVLNWVYNKYIKPRDVEYFGFLDHDVFPVKKTSILAKFNESNIYGLPQPRRGMWYLWAGFCFFRSSFLEKKHINFMSGKTRQDRFDTGGSNWKPLYSKIDMHSLPSISATYKQFFVSKHSQVGGIEIMGDWVHLANSSNWMHATKKDVSRKKDYVVRFLRKYA